MSSIANKRDVLVDRVVLTFDGSYFPEKEVGGAGFCISTFPPSSKIVEKGIKLTEDTQYYNSTSSSAEAKAFEYGAKYLYENFSELNQVRVHGDFEEIIQYLNGEYVSFSGPSYDSICSGKQYLDKINAQEYIYNTINSSDNKSHILAWNAALQDE